MNILIKLLDKYKSPQDREETVAKTTDTMISTMQKLIDEEQEAKTEARKERDVQRELREACELRVQSLEEEIKSQRLKTESITRELNVLKEKYDEHINEHHKGEK